MKRVMFSALALVVVAALCGCRACHRGQNSCACMGDGSAPAVEGCVGQDGQVSDNCDDPNGCARRHICPLCHGHGCGRCRGQGADGAEAADAAAAGPPAGAVTYPYYTVRGPRDFLMKNPPSIGP
jgi:hypothetical protein